MTAHGITQPELAQKSFTNSARPHPHVFLLRARSAGTVAAYASVLPSL